jgi:uncharacterized protein (TIRG00374 family)
MTDPANPDGQCGAPAIALLRLGRGVASVLLGLGIAAAAVWLLGVRPGAVLVKAAGTPPLVIAGCIVSGYVVLALQTLRWHQVMHPLLGLRYRDALSAQIIGAMLNAILPARGGDFLRAQYLGNLTGRSRATILGTELVDRWLDWWGWVPVVGILALTSPLPAWIRVALVVFGGALLVWGAAMVIACRRHPDAVSRSRVAEIVRSFRAGLDAFASRRTLVIALLVAPLPWVWEAAVLAAAGRAFDVHLTFSMAFCVLVGLNAAMVVPAPGGIGAVETGGAAVLVLFGLDRAGALAFLFVYHLTQLVPAIAAGAILFALRPRPVFRAVETRPGDVSRPSHARGWDVAGMRGP